MKKILILIIIFLTITIYAEENPNVDKMFEFAEHLFEQKEYYRAITEYERLIFYYPNENKTIQSKFKIGLCYFNGEKWEQALKTFQAIANDYPDKEEGKLSFIKLADCYFQQKEYNLAINELNNFIEDNPMDKNINTVYFMSGVYSLYDNNINLAVENFKKTNNSELLNIPADFQKLPEKSPVLAGTLSGILPGAGQIYTERYNDGMLSCLLNGIFIWGAVESFKNNQEVAGGIITFFELGWYTGNIYNAAGNAYKYNKRKKEKFLENIKNKYSDFFHSNLK